MISVIVTAGDVVQAGDKVATIEAMKMESAVTAGIAGTVATVHVSDTSQVEPGDLVVTLTPASTE